MKRLLQICLAFVTAGIVSLKHIERGWCIYHEVSKGKGITFVGLCSGSFAKSTLTIHRAYFGQSIFYKNTP
jgi:hypothetical protein